MSITTTTITTTATTLTITTPIIIIKEGSMVLDNPIHLQMHTPYFLIATINQYEDVQRAGGG